MVRVQVETESSGRDIESVLRDGDEAVLAESGEWDSGDVDVVDLDGTGLGGEELQEGEHEGAFAAVEMSGR